MDNGAIDEIRARINIEDLVSEYLELRRAGRNFKALSPWTDERTPSFIVSPEKQIWHDFSSGKGGDIFGFIMEVEGMTFRESLEFLARKSGVELKKFDNHRSKQIAEKKKRLYEILETSTNIFQNALIRNDQAKEYVFKKRKLSQEVVREFKIGYAPNTSRAVVDFLLKKGFSKQDIKDAGMTNRFDGDIFRDRIVITLQDSSGLPVGFTGRLINEVDNSPKYLNTPQTLLYDKSSNVFGLHQAKNYIRKEGFAVIVEGNMDVISSHQVGVKNVVATAGTAMTVQHLKMISRFSNDIRICFDSDDAGVSATERAISLSQDAGVELSIISLDQSRGSAKDPDELIQIDTSLWKKSIQNPHPAVEWILDQYQKKLDISSASGKKQFSNISLKIIEKLNDPVEKEFYLNEVANRLNTSKEALLAKTQKVSGKPKPKRRIKSEKMQIQTDEFIYEDDLLALAVMEDDLSKMIKDLPKDSLHGEQRNQVFSILQNDEKEKLKKMDNYVKILLLKADERLGKINEEAEKEMARLVDKVKTQKLLEQKEDFQEKLEEAEISGDDDLKMRILSEIMRINKELNSGKR